MEHKIYILPDVPIAFFDCGIENSENHGLCTDYYIRDDGRVPKYYCNRNNIHFCCPEHSNVELYRKKVDDDYFGETVFWCDKCAQVNERYTGIKLDTEELTKRARILINSEEFKKAKRIRIDEQCEEIKLERLRKSNGNYISAWGNIETDRNENPQINLYIGYNGDKKVHYFIEPELGRIRYELSNTDIDPGKILAKITLETRDNRTSQEYKQESYDEQ